MSFTSYAQNFEDVILWRALKQVERGFYIDVGAMDPNQDSVTKAFYEQGWRGINIEPVTQWYERLEKERIRDINLQMVVGAQDGETILYEIPNTGLSTVDKNIAEKHEFENNYRKIERIILIKTLNEICLQYHVAPLHFLKIDVEGSEKQVLQGIDFSILRPWIILIESTFPNTQIENHIEWDPILLAANYEFVYFDGLNRFYLAYEHQELKDNLRTPPNYFDGFILDGSTPYCNHIMAQTVRTSADASAALSQIKHLSILLEEKNQALVECQARLVERQNHAQWLQSEWETAKAQLGELTKELAVKAEALITCDATLAQSKVHNEWLQHEWNTSRIKLDELVAQLAVSKQGEQHLNEELLQQRQVLSASNNMLTEYQAHSRWLQNEWNVAKIRLDELAAEIVSAEQSILSLSEQLAEKSQSLTIRENALIDEQARSQWLQNEWNAAKAKIDELARSSHYWENAVDKLNSELQSIYRRKSWRITWPLRKALQLLHWIFGLPKRAIKPILLFIMHFVLKRPIIKFRVINVLAINPQLKEYLRQFAIQNNLIGYLPESSLAISSLLFRERTATEEIYAKDGFGEPDLTILTPQARSIYSKLKQVLAQH